MPVAAPNNDAHPPELAETSAQLKLTLGAAAPEDCDLVPFLRASEGDVLQASAKVRASLEAREEYGKLTIENVAQFYRAPAAGRKHPDGCLLLLEDMKGGVHRDAIGRPIVVGIGMLHGTGDEMKQQYAYLSELLATHKLPEGPRGACVVMEVRPRDAGAPPTFRFPDRDVRKIFDLGRDIYPDSLYSTTHFCGLPRAVAWAFKFVRPFMSGDAYAGMVLKPTFAHLRGLIPKESLLQQWGGELSFDIDEWLEWRATMEGVPLDRLCPRNHGRPFDAASADGAMGGAPALIASEVTSGASLHGVVEKRGSGRGVFGTVRWKPKLLAVSPVGLVYFDQLDADSAKNTAARVVSLGEPGTIVARRGVTSGDGTVGTPARPFQFALVCATREYLFAVSTEEEAARWIAALEAEIAVARQTHRELMSSGVVSVGETMSSAAALGGGRYQKQYSGDI